ncbi:MAG: acyltransferase [Verrucomicrobia bacterium]|nr:acyltransferase [Verrucomicrobiota bacterium]
MKRTNVLNTTVAGSGRNPRIDGLRGLAIGLVLYHHLRVSLGVGPPVWFPFDGLLGVCLFFVISGYLITTLLLRERAETGTISLWRFYGRRVVRIFPAFYFFLIMMVVARAMGWVQFDQRGLFASLFYFRNVGSYGDTVLQHTWSLAVEEQFYLVWPFLIAWSPRRFWGAWIAVGLLAKPLLTLAISGGYPTAAVALNSASFDAIFWGVALAFWLNGAGHRWLKAESSPGPARFEAAAVLAMVGLWGLYHTAGQWTGPITVLAPVARNALVAYMLLYCLARGGAWLTARPLVTVGLFSYSLYLWQQPFLVGKIDSLGSLAVRVGGMLVLAGISYYIIERTTLRWRRHFARASHA